MVELGKPAKLRTRYNNPMAPLLDEMKPLGVTLSAGVVSAVGTGVIDFDIDGATIPDVPYIGGEPSVDDQLWALRHGTTILPLSVGAGASLDYLPLTGGEMTGTIEFPEVGDGVKWWNTAGTGQAWFEVWNDGSEDIFRLRIGGDAPAISKFSIHGSGDAILAEFHPTITKIPADVLTLGGAIGFTEHKTFASSYDTWGAIYSDNGTYDALMILGNKAAGGSRIIKMYDQVYVTSTLYADGDIDSSSTDLALKRAGATKVVIGTGGIVVTGEVFINDGNSAIGEGAGNSLRNQTNSGYVDIGPQNTGGAHIYTDRAVFYFNKSLAMVGASLDLGTSDYPARYAWLNTAIVPTALWAYNNVNGSIRWMGEASAMRQAHTSSSLAHKKNIAPIRTRGADGVESTTGAIFDRLDPIWFRYRQSHPQRDRWKGRRPRADKLAEIRERRRKPNPLLPPIDPADDEWYEDDDTWDSFENPAIGRMGFGYEQMAEVAPHYTYVVDGMEAISYEGMLPDFMAWAVATIRGLRDRVTQLEATPGS